VVVLLRLKCVLCVGWFGEPDLVSFLGSRGGGGGGEGVSGVSNLWGRRGADGGDGVAVALGLRGSRFGGMYGDSCSCPCDGWGGAISCGSLRWLAEGVFCCCAGGSGYGGS